MKIVAGSNPNDAVSVEQNAQCPECTFFLMGEDGEDGKSFVTLMNFVPAAEQISIKEIGELLVALTVWKIDGASPARKIAKNAIQTVSCRVILFIPMLEFYL